MTIAIPVSPSMLQALGNMSHSLLKISIGTGESSIHLFPINISCQVTYDYQTWSFQFKNDGMFQEGSFASQPACVSFSHDGQEWITLFYGLVSPDGLKRTIGMLTDDRVTCELVDLTRSKGVRRTLPEMVFTDLYISNPSDPEHSILHILAAHMGVASLDCGLIPHIKNLLPIGGTTAWNELKKLRDAYGAMMYFDSSGRLRFRSFQEQGWTDPVSEWTFIADPSTPLTTRSSRIVGKISSVYNERICTKAVSNVDMYEKRSERVIFRDTTDWNSDLEQCNIIIPAGGMYPNEGVASLAYKDPDTGDSYPYAVNVQVPTIGQNSQYDICYTGGRLELDFFSAIQEPNACRLMLRNSGTSSCIITKLTIRGEPYVLLSKSDVMEKDDSITDETDHTELTIDGCYAASVQQIDAVLSRLVSHGKLRGRHLEFQCAFIPIVQRGMVCTVVMPGGESVECIISTYSHSCQGPTLAAMRTSVSLDEIGEFEPVSNMEIVNIPVTTTVPRKGDEGPPGPQGEDVYKVDIHSTNGIMFRTGTQYTTLVARVYRGTSEITEQLSSAAFRWKRTSESAIGDAAWNSAHETGYKEVILTPADFIGRTSFTCEIKEVS